MKGISSLGILVCLTLSGCASGTMWPRTEEFLGHLRCGMSAGEVAEVVKGFRGLKYSDSRRGAPWDKLVKRRRTNISLAFDEHGLRQAEVIWNTGILSADGLPIHDFCEGSSAFEEPSKASDG